MYKYLLPLSYITLFPVCGVLCLEPPGTFCLDGWFSSRMAGQDSGGRLIFQTGSVSAAFHQWKGERSHSCRGTVWEAGRRWWCVTVTPHAAVCWRSLRIAVLFHTKTQRYSNTVTLILTTWFRTRTASVQKTQTVILFHSSTGFVRKNILSVYSYSHHKTISAPSFFVMMQKRSMLTVIRRCLHG